MYMYMGYATNSETDYGPQNNSSWLGFNNSLLNKLLNAEIYTQVWSTDKVISHWDVWDPLHAIVDIFARNFKLILYVTFI